MINRYTTHQQKRRLLMKKMLKALATGIILAAALTMTACANPSGGSGIPPLAPSGIDYSLAKVGDIILQDGSICKPNDFNSATMTAVAVIFREMSASKCAVGIALSEAKNKPWCLDTAAGYSAIPALTNGGCQDSREAYAKLAAACASDIATTGNYPAWEYCAKYGVTENLPAPFNVGWCLPSYVELRDLVTNSVNVSAGLSKARGTILTTTPFVKTGLNSQRQMLVMNITMYPATRMDQMLHVLILVLMLIILLHQNILVTNLLEELNVLQIQL